MPKYRNYESLRMNQSKCVLYLMFILILSAVILTSPLPAYAETVVDVPVNQGDDYSRMYSKDFSIRMEEEDIVSGYHHQSSGDEAIPTEVYARLTFSKTSEVWLGIDLPMITRGTSYSAISYDLLTSDRQTVICSHRRSLEAYKATYLMLFRGVLPAGTYYLRLHHFYNGDCYTTLKTKLTTEFSCGYPIQEDDLKGSNNTRESAAVLADSANGYLSYLGNDPADWYVFDAGAEGAVLTAERLGEGRLSFAIYDENGAIVTEKQPLYDALTDEPVKNELKEGRYYLCISYEEADPSQNILNRRGGLYSISLKQNASQTGSGSSGSTSGGSTSSGSQTGGSSSTGTTAGGSSTSGNTGTSSASGSSVSKTTTSLKKGSIKKISGQKYKVTKLAGSGKKGTVSLKTAANKKAVTVPASVKISGRIYLVTAIEADAFRGAKIRSVEIGKNVTRIAKYAFRKSKAVTVTLKTKKLTKASVKNCLKNSVVRKILVKPGTKKVNAAWVKKYKKYFTKANAGRKITVK